MWRIAERHFETAGFDIPIAIRLVSDAQLLAGFVWDYDPAITTSPPADERCINVKRDYGPRGPVDSYYYARPSSHHPSGVNAAMCDASVFFLRENIEYKVYEQLMTSNGAKSNMQGPRRNPNAPINYVLQEADYRKGQQRLTSEPGRPRPRGLALFAKRAVFGASA